MKTLTFVCALATFATRSNTEKMLKVYGEKPAGKRPVWLVRADGSDVHVIECLRFQCAIDGSRASWKPLAR